MGHPLEKEYGLAAVEILDAIKGRFRLKVAVEGAIAEVKMEKSIAALPPSLMTRYEAYDLDGSPDFAIWLPGKDTPIFAECKNARNQSYKRAGKLIAYMVETQKTRAARGDFTSRYYDIGQFHVLGVCLGKQTGNWSDFMFARTADLERHIEHPHKLKVLHAVPVPGTPSEIWSNNIADIVRKF